MKNDLKEKKFGISIKHKFLLICPILINLFNQISSKENKILYKKNLFSFDNEITIKINQKGLNPFIGVTKISKIHKIIVNDINKTIENNNNNQVNLSEFNNTIKIIFKQSDLSDLFGLFLDCYTISEIDLSNFNTSNVQNMQEAFNGCKSLISINFANFDTTKVTNMHKMFMNCEKLISLDLSNFHTNSLVKMDQMFNNCTNIVTINLSNLNATFLADIYQTFKDCPKLKYINLINAKMTNVRENYGIFEDSPSNIIISTKDIDTINKLKQYSNINFIILNCSSDYENIDYNNGNSFFTCEELYYDGNSFFKSPNEAQNIKYTNNIINFKTNQISTTTSFRIKKNR